MAPKRTTGDAVDVVRRCIAEWADADEIDRGMMRRTHGPAPEPAAVPYGWLKWKGTRRLRGEYHANYNAIRRAVLRMEKAGELVTYVFAGSGRLAWVIVTEKCNNRPGQSEV